MPEGAETAFYRHNFDEFQRLEELSGQPSRRMLSALLARCTSLDLSGKVYGVSSVQRSHGGYSDVYTGYCMLSSDVVMKVAVKKLRVHIMGDENFQKKLAKELYIWSKLSHPRVLPLEGFFLEGGNYPSLVSKWMENGTVLKYLNANPDADLLALTTGIAEGIDYLHASDIVHSDIKPDNILISESGEPLLCDFGVSRILAASTTFHFSSTLTGGLRGTIRYMSREILSLSENQPATYSKESDVWAFGMTVLTLLTKSPPYAEFSIDAQVLVAIALGSLPSCPAEFIFWSSQGQNMWRMCERCWEPISERPSMQSILAELQNIEGMSGETSKWSTVDSSKFELRLGCRGNGKDPSRPATSSSLIVPDEETAASESDPESESNPFQWGRALEEHFPTAHPEKSSHYNADVYAGGLDTSLCNSSFTASKGFCNVGAPEAKRVQTVPYSPCNTPSSNDSSISSVRERPMPGVLPDAWDKPFQCNLRNMDANLQQIGNRAITSCEEKVAGIGRFKRIRRKTWHGGLGGSYYDPESCRDSFP